MTTRTPRGKEPQPRSRATPATYRARRLAVGAVVLAVVASLGFLTAQALSGASSTPPGRTVAAVGTSKTAVSSTTTALRLSAPYPVGRLLLTFDEPSSASISTSDAPAGHPSRVLRTWVRYPASASLGVGGGSPRPPARGSGPFPLIVFSQGFDIPAESYGVLMHAWARAGYVVAAPTYPHTSLDGPGPVNEKDIVNHPADLRFVISALLAASNDRSNPLHGLIDQRHIAVVGHSDGGDVSFALAANTCCKDPRVKAVVVLSGAKLSSFGGRYVTAGSPPLLVVQGTADTVNPQACSIMLYDPAHAPKFYLEIPAAEHEPPYLSPGPMRRGVEATTTAFLDAYLKGAPKRLRALKATGNLPAGETLTSRPHLPLTAGSYCPGA